MGGQAPSDTGVAEGRAQAARGDFYRALLTLKDATRQLEARPEAKSQLAFGYASLAWACLGMNRPEEAQSAVERALKVDPGIVVASPDFPATVVSLFDRARRPTSEDPEEAGRRALKAGRPQEALLEFLRALESMPAPAAAEEVERIRREVIETVIGMDPKPQLPTAAAKHLNKAKELEEAQALFGSSPPTATAAILEELEAAVRLAPWWPEALFRLGQSQHSLGRIEESLSTLRLYKLADPAGAVSASRRLLTLPHLPPKPRPRPNPRARRER